MSPGRARADRLVLAAGLAPTRERARALILAGKVMAGSRRVEKAGELLPPDSELRVLGATHPFVSRGGVKLEHGLRRFGVSVRGARCLDVGASTGGFTDCLLQAGADHVVALDVGRGQLDWGLRNDERVTVLEGVNARHLEAAQVGGAVGFVSADVAFISLTKVLPALNRAAPEAELVLLVKPQFEAGRGRVGKGGVVRDPAVWRDVLDDVASCLVELGYRVVAATASPLAGPAGNREFLLHARPEPGAGAPDPSMLASAVEEALGRSNIGAEASRRGPSAEPVTDAADGPPAEVE